MKSWMFFLVAAANNALPSKAAPPTARFAIRFHFDVLEPPNARNRLSISSTMAAGGVFKAPDGNRTGITGLSASALAASRRSAYSFSSAVLPAPGNPLNDDRVAYLPVLNALYCIVQQCELALPTCEDPGRGAVTGLGQSKERVSNGGRQFACFHHALILALCQRASTSYSYVLSY